MKNNWFRSQSELDPNQRRFTKLPVTGKYFLKGPPGSGKTNLLLLRAAMTAASGKRNVLIITFTNALANFMKTGIPDSSVISPDQIKTYHSWAFEHIGNTLGYDAVPDFPSFNEDSRPIIYEAVLQSNQNLLSRTVYDAIFVDEAQDFSEDELNALLCLSDNICICGDSNQGIYYKNGLSVIDKLELEKYELAAHFRIGQAIAKVADKICVPANGSLSLEDTSNYDEFKLGTSSANIHDCGDRDDQFEKILQFLKIQLDAFPEDTIGIFCGKKETCVELRERFDGTDLKDLVCVQRSDEFAFSEEKRIYVLTMHSSKGTEFRAVHIFGLEEIYGTPLQKRPLTYTAVTRAKTSLNAYFSGRTVSYLESAFAEQRHSTLDDILPR